jgi:membrane protein YqaA with SNARE-associated domain
LVVSILIIDITTIIQRLLTNRAWYTYVSMTRRRIVNLVIFLSLITVGVFGSLVITEFVIANPEYQAMIQEFGFLGVLLISFVAGLNLFLPLPAATFVPVFTAGGMSLPSVIFFLIVGTMAANLFAYTAGHYGGKVAKIHYPAFQEKMTKLYQNHRRYMPHFVFLFTALIPLPDEVFLVPLGIIGVKLKQFILPLLCGTIFYQTFAAYGIDNIFKYLL